MQWGQGRSEGIMINLGADGAMLLTAFLVIAALIIVSRSAQPGH
jgi:uncharacterized membrane protein